MKIFRSLNSAQDKRAQVKEEMDKKIAQLDEVNANFLTKSTDLVHFEEYKGRLNQEVNSAKVTCERLQNKIREYLFCRCHDSFIMFTQFPFFSYLQKEPGKI